MNTKPIFTTEALAAEHSVASPPNLLRFDADAMKTPAGEETILVARASKEATNPIAFYRAALAAETPDWVGTLCRPIDHEALVERVQMRIRSLRDPFELALGSAFVAAMVMEQEWNVEVLFIETECEYILFYWDTTA